MDLPRSPESDLSRRYLLRAAFLVGVLTALTAGAGNLVNLVKGPPAWILAITGTVLAFMAGVVSTLVTVWNHNHPPSQRTGKRLPIRRGMKPAPRSGLHPVVALRYTSFPTAALAMIVGAGWLPYRVFHPSWVDPGEQAFQNGMAAAVFGGLACILVFLICFDGHDSGGFDLVLAYTGATITGDHRGRGAQSGCRPVGWWDCAHASLGIRREPGVGYLCRGNENAGYRAPGYGGFGGRRRTRKRVELGSASRRGLGHFRHIAGKHSPRARH
jgi:hypothetical protein